MSRNWLFLAFFAAACLLLLPWVARRMSVVSIALAANEESQAVLATALADLKTLSHCDPSNSALYRRHFDDAQNLLHHLQIFALSRQELVRRAEAAIFLVFGAIAAASIAFHLAEQRRRARRIARLGDALEALSHGEGVVTVGDAGRDIIGTFAAMIEETSRVMTSERKRVQVLEHLSSWQEAARRHAHEMRTPLTTARMEVTSLMRSIAPQLPDAAGELQRREESIVEELERLRRFTNNFVAFASLSAPTLRLCNLGLFTSEFCALFAPNWPQLRLSTGTVEQNVCAMADTAMLRQVLVNLCNNSALAIGPEGRGSVTLSVSARGSNAVLDVADDGPGMPPEIRRRLFQPYTTTRKIGEGIGLGLAISKKILLDHGGDLELVDSDRGAAFRLTLPRVEC